MSLYLWVSSSDTGDGDDDDDDDTSCCIQPVEYNRYTHFHPIIIIIIIIIITSSSSFIIPSPSSSASHHTIPSSLSSSYQVDRSPTTSPSLFTNRAVASSAPLRTVSTRRRTDISSARSSIKYMYACWVISDRLIDYPVSILDRLIDYPVSILVYCSVSNTHSCIQRFPIHSTHLSIYQSIYLHPSIYLSIYSSTHPSITYSYAGRSA